MRNQVEQLEVHRNPRRALRRATAAAILAMLGLVTACSSDAGAPEQSVAEGELTTVRIASQPNADQGALFLGEEEGIFEKYGFALEYPPVAAAGSGATAQLLNGQVDINIGSIGAVIAAVAQGIPVRAISAYSIDFEKDGQTGHSLIVPEGSDVSTPKDLEGKTVGANSLQSNWEVEVRETVAKDGGDPSLVNMVAVPFADQAAAIRQGRIDAIVTVQPFASQLLGEGYVSLGDPMTIALDNPEGSSGYMMAAQKFLDDNLGFLEKWQAAVDEASEFANENPDLTRQAIAEKTGVSLDVLEAAPLPLFSGKLDPEGVQAWSDLFAKYGIVDAAPSADDIIATP